MNQLKRKTSRFLKSNVLDEQSIFEEQYQEIQQELIVIRQEVAWSIDTEKQLYKIADKIRAGIRKCKDKKQLDEVEKLNKELEENNCKIKEQESRTYSLRCALTDKENELQMFHSTKVVAIAKSRVEKASTNADRLLSKSGLTSAEFKYTKMEKSVEEKERNSKYPTQTTQTESGLSIVEERLLKMEKVVLANEKKANEALKRFGNITDKEFDSMSKKVLTQARKLVDEAMLEGLDILIMLDTQGVETKSDIKKLETKKKPWLDRLEKAQNDNDQELVEDCQTWLEQAKVLESQNEEQLDSISKMLARIEEIHPQLEKLEAKIEKRLETLEQAKESTQ